MAITDDVEKVIRALESEGYRVDIEQYADSVALIASKGDLRVNILFQMEAHTLERLLLSFSDRPELTILDCEEPDKVSDCIRKLVSVLKDVSQQCET